jgi:subtilisin family serine protease
MLVELKKFNVLEISNTRNTKDSIQYGVKMIGAESQWKETKGKNIKVAVVDTGIDFNHPDLIERVKGGVDFTTSNPNDYMDRNGHGTHCAGVIAATINDSGVVGVAPEAELYAVKILSDEGKGQLDWLISSIDWCIDNKINIMSMSLGVNEDNDRMFSAIKKAYNAGIIMVCAAGNDSQGESVNTVDYPAKYKETISVAAIDLGQKIGNFSSRGNEIEVSAAGVEVFSTYPNNKYAKLSGTSMATPHIAGSVALIQSKALNRYGRFLTTEEVRLILQMNSKDLGIKGKDSSFGYGAFSFDQNL